MWNEAVELRSCRALSRVVDADGVINSCGLLVHRGCRLYCFWLSSKTCPGSNLHWIRICFLAANHRLNELPTVVAQNSTVVHVRRDPAEKSHPEMKLFWCERLDMEDVCEVCTRLVWTWTIKIFTWFERVWRHRRGNIITFLRFIQIHHYTVHLLYRPQGNFRSWGFFTTVNRLVTSLRDEKDSCNTCAATDLVLTSLNRVKFTGNFGSHPMMQWRLESYLKASVATFLA